jgi:hypothetical protein
VSNYTVALEKLLLLLELALALSAASPKFDAMKRTPSMTV